MKKTKILCIVLAVLMIYMFASIFVTVGLTGGRDIKDFTDSDKRIFSVFVILEIIAVASMFALAITIGKSFRTPIQEKIKPSPLDKALKKRDAKIFGISFVSAFILSLLGIILLKNVSPDVIAVIFLSLIAVFAFALFINFYVGKAYVDRFSSRSHSEMITFLVSHRDHAERSSQILLRKLTIILTATKIYTVFIAILGSAICFISAGLGLWSFMTLISAGIIYAALGRIHLPYPKELFTKDNGYVDEEEYPELYAVANEAREALGVEGEIRIVLLADFTAGIRRFGNVISIQIGAMLFGAMSREELKNILLHEFGHLKGEESPSREVIEHNWWLGESGGKPGTLSYVTDILFRLPDSLFGINYMLYSYASTIGIEEMADEAMKKYGDPKYAGSSLLKLQYYELHNWEEGSYDTPSACESETLEADLVRRELGCLKERTQARRPLWNRLIDVEIISRSATHPTIKMRLDALGHTDYSIHESSDSESYKSEQNKVIDFIDGNIYDRRKESYEEERKDRYLDPLATVSAWEESDGTIDDNYRDVICAYRRLGRVSEANELCDRVINELPASANHYALYMKGCTLLHSLDESGIELIYQAIEENHNYIEEGMQTIGQFCCISGRQDDLDLYRERALKLMDEQEQKYSELQRLTPRDNLASESLPEEIRKGLLELIGSMSEAIDEVYVVRKVITGDFFASAVIVKTKDGIDPEMDNALFNKIFLYLDAQDWEFTLFDAKDVPMNVVKKIPLSLFYGEKDNSVDIRRYLP